MSLLLERWLPWLADLLELGGPVLGLILVIAFTMCVLLFERLYYLLAEFPRELERAERHDVRTRRRLLLAEVSWRADDRRHE